MLSALLQTMRRLCYFTLLIGSLFLLANSGSPAYAATGINKTINFQGRLYNAQGATVPDGYYNIQFKIYQDGDGQTAGNTTGSPAGTLKWTENHLNAASQGVQVKNGFMSVELGSITAFGSNIDWNQDTLWLSLNIGNTNGSCTPFTSCSGDGEMLPMKRFSSVPYALNASMLEGKAAGDFVQNTTTVQSANIALQSANASSVGAVIQGAASQTADIFQVKANAVSTPLFGVSSAGSVTITPTSDASPALTVNSTTGTLLTVATSGIGLNENVSIAAGKSLTLTGGNTASRPASPTEGMVYFDTTTKQLLVYSNGKWQADRSTATKIVAASNSSQAVKDAADYVADGTGDQTEINSALTAAAGGKVYLAEGTYVANATILIPNNTALIGAGSGTLIEMADIDTTDNLIENSNTTTGTGVTIQSLRISGRKDLNTAGTQYGIYLNGMGGGSGSGARSGATLSQLSVTNFNSRGVSLSNSSNNTISNNSFQDNDGFNLALSGGSEQNIITGNLFQGSGSAYGISIGGSSYNTVSSNTITGNANGGIILQSSSSYNVVSDNTLRDNGGSGANDSINVSASDNNTISNNRITDTAGSGYAIRIVSGTANYLSGNSFSGTGATSINDAGTATSYGGQVNATGAFALQNAGGIALGSLGGTSSNGVTINTGNASAGASGNITIDTGTATTTAGTISIGTSNTSALTIGRSGVTTTIQGNVGVTLNATTGTTMVCRNGSGLLSSCDATYLAPTATNFIQNQNAAAQTTSNFWISGTGKADTALLTPRLDTDTAAALSIGDVNASSVTIGKAAGTAPVNVSSSTVNLGVATTATTMQAVGQTTANAQGSSLTMQGATGNGSGAGGNVTIQGGTGGATNAAGGNLYLSGGTATGSSTSTGLVVINTPTFTTAASDANCYTGGALVASSCTITAASVNGSGAIIVGFNTTAKTATLPDPTITTAGRIVYITAANSSEDFTLSVNGGGTGNTIAMRKNTTATMIWNGNDWTAAGASSSTTLQSAYDNTLQSAGGAELVVSSTANTKGLTIRDSSTSPVNGTLVSVQSSSAAGLFQVNSNVTEYASNAGSESGGAGGGLADNTYPANTWNALTGTTISRYTTAGDYIATGQGSVSAVTTAVANTGVANQLSTTLNANMTYNVSFTTRISTGTFTDMNVYYSRDGTTSGGVTCTAAATSITSVWTKVNCTFTAPSSGITSSNAIFIRQTGATARTFYVDNLSVTIAADYNYATDGNVNNSGSFATNWPAVGTSTVTRNTTDGQEASDSAQVAAGTTADNGVKNKLAINPLASTLYRVSVYAKLVSGSAFTDFKVRYTPDNGTNFVDCVDYNTQTVVTTGWTQITCYIKTVTTTVSNPYLHFTQPSAPGSARTYLVDSLSMTLSSASTPNVQIGGGSNGGPTTLFTLDRGASAPIAANNDALLGSMYYDTTLGKLQCYEADGWGACGSSPDNIITISPEYTNAVLHGTGIGTLTSDLCSDNLNINDGSSSQPTICGTNETYNFYKWTSPQSTAQTYSIYVTYQLPSTFKQFNSGSTSLMGRTDSTNSTVAYQVYKNTSSGLTQCGSTITVSTGVKTTWQPGPATGAADPSTCSFAAGNSVVFKIDVTASSNANAYVGNLNFAFSNR